MRSMHGLAAIGAVLALGVASEATAKDEPAFGPLKARFQAAAGAERLQALAALRAVKTAECVRFLDEVRRADADAQVRQQALSLIGQVGVDPARAILEGVLDQGDAAQRPLALDALGSIRPEVPPDRFLRALGPTEAQALRQAAVRALQRYPREDVADALAATLLEAPGPANVAEEALAALRALIARAPVDAWFVTRALAARSPFAAAAPRLLRIAAGCPNAGLPAALLEHAERGAPGARAPACDALGDLEAGKGAEAQAAQDALARLLKDRDPEVVLAAVVALGRIGPTGGGLEAVLALCKGNNPQQKTLGLGALGPTTRDARAVRAAADAIDDATFSVRAAAVDALAKIATKEAIAALIKGLKKNDDGRLHADICDALVRLTHARAGATFAEWDRWWRMVEADFRVPGGEPPRQASGREHAPAAGGGSRSRAPTFYGSEVRSDRLTLVVDVSGSMSAVVRGDADPDRVASGPGAPAPAAPAAARTRIEIAKEQVANVIAALRDGAVLNVIPFDHTPSPWRPRAVVLGRGERQAALDLVAGLRPQGGTNIYDPLELALQDPTIDTIYLMSDGAPGSGKFVAEDDILREVKKLNAVRRVAIHTVSVGMDSSLMRRLAEENGGRCTVVD